MATKDELIQFASSHGVDVSSSWTKAEIEAALVSAGYDPNTVGGTDTVTETAPSGAEDMTSEAGAEALEQGYMGAVPDEIENEAYTVEGQGAETARREREQIGALRAARWELNDQQASA